MHKLTITLIAILCITSCHAVKDVRIWVTNNTPTPLRVEGPGQPPLTLLQWQTGEFCGGDSTRVSVFRWCPTGSSPYKAVMTIQGDNPWIGPPRLTLMSASGDRYYREFNEGDQGECNSPNPGTSGFYAGCWRDSDTGDKRFHVYIKGPPQACPAGRTYQLSTCPKDEASLAICNA